MGRQATQELIPVGMFVEATNFDGTVVRGNVVCRNWFFDQLLFYVVREPARGRAYDVVPEYHIYPERDPIRVVHY